MIVKYYNCEFLSDIVLPQSSNTQGNIALNDFIPGSNFLGIVAKYYDKFDDSFKVFHSGDVCFGDGHIKIDDKLSYKVPLSYHRLKIGDGFYNRLHLNDNEGKNLREEQKQLKQLRNEFINEDLNSTILEYNYTQKSSYDKDLRRSKDEGMYGYSALKSGTNWIFKISYKDEKHIKQIENYLLGNQKLGKSKSSQYGNVNITKIDDIKQVDSFTPKDKLTYIYINSRVVLFEEDGTFTTIPTISNLGLSSGKILWDKTFIRTSSYTPYNYKRQTKEYTRVYINKGSVITIENTQDTIPSKMGAFLNEGFGDILVNPKFLEPKYPNLKKYEKEEGEKEAKNYDKSLILFLQAKEDKEQAKFEVASQVQNIYEKLIAPSKSQWGEIRSMASIFKDKDDLISKIDEYISKGVAKTQWEGKKELLFSEIRKSKDPMEFTKLLSMIIAKHTKGGNDGK